MRYDTPTADELKLVYDSWASSFRRSPWAGCIPNHLYESVSRAAIGDILSRGARVICAVEDIEGGRRVAGYSVSEPDTSCLHWLYVKRDYRGLGIGRALLGETTASFARPRFIYTHRTLSSGRFLGPEFHWDPVPARTRKVTP